MPTNCFLVADNDDAQWKTPGAISNWPSPDGTPNWMLCLPNGGHWSIYGRMADGSPGWNVTGELPSITARPSIFAHAHGVHGGTHYEEYHGWLTDGVLSDDLEGRTYP